MQRHVLRFKGRFDRFETISADSGPQNVKNIFKMGFFGKTPGVNGLIKIKTKIENTSFFLAISFPGDLTYADGGDNGIN